VGGTSLLRADEDRIQGRKASIAPTAAACTPTPDAADGVPTSARPGGCGGFLEVVTAAATELKPAPVRFPARSGATSRPVDNAVGTVLSRDVLGVLGRSAQSHTIRISISRIKSPSTFSICIGQNTGLCALPAKVPPPDVLSRWRCRHTDCGLAENCAGLRQHTDFFLTPRRPRTPRPHPPPVRQLPAPSPSLLSSVWLRPPLPPRRPGPVHKSDIIVRCTPQRQCAQRPPAPPPNSQPPSAPRCRRPNNPSDGCVPS
jgi:hypothetical protein